MTPLDAILAHVNRKLGKNALYRELLVHAEWRVPWPPEGQQPTVIVADAALTGSVWAFSTQAAYEEACKKVTAEAIGPLRVLQHLDDALVDDDSRVARLSIDPSSPIAFHIQTDELAAFRLFARGVRVERAMAQRNYAEVRAFPRYAVPYFGELGHGHNLVCLPSDRGSMLAAFTAPDAIEAFLEAGSDENRASVKFILVNGEQLFGVAHEVGQGVLVNAMGPKIFGFDLDACRDVAASTV